MNEWQRNLLVTSVYILSLLYVFSRITEDLDNFIAIEFDRDSFNEQLEKQEIADALDIDFSFSSLYRPDAIKDLCLTIANKSEHKSMYINWEQCTLTDFYGQSRRVIRLIPGMDLDLSQVQVFGVAAPGQSLTEQVVAEESLKRNSDGILSVVKPLFSPGNLRSASEKNSKFTFRLVVEIAGSAVDNRSGNIHALQCNFLVKKPPMQKRLIW